MPDAPIRVALTPQVEEHLRRDIRRHILGLKAGYSVLHQTKIGKWRKFYEATPLEKIREFPFYNASNLVVPVIAIHSDTLLARVMSYVFKTKPLWVTKLLGTHQGVGEELREAIEEFLEYVGIEPTELDLYRVYHEWFGEAIKFGTAIVKSPYEKIWEDVVAGDGQGSHSFLPVTIYAGPRPEKLAFEDFLIPPASKTLEAADIKIHRRRLLEFELTERAFHGVYAQDKVNYVLGKPTRTFPISTQQRKETDTGARSSVGYGYKEWDIWECWYKTIINGHLVRTIISYHLESNTILRALYNFYPENMEPFVAARLYYRDDQFHGLGFCERLSHFQNELSIIHNQRRDNMTIANTRIWRANPDSKLHQGYRIYPSAILPAEKDEIEPLMHGELSAVTIEDERMTLDLAERLSGVAPQQQGYGAGVMHGRRGVYTAMGTLSMLQESNTRTDLNVTDMRYAHTKLGRIITRVYAHFGVGDRVEQFGEKAPNIRAALELMASGRMGLPIYASTASVNREVEKQNDIMLVGLMTRHYQTVASLLQTASNVMIPEEVRQYLGQAVQASNALMKDVLRNFGRSETDRLVPEVKRETNTSGQSSQAPGVDGAAGGQGIQ